MKFYHVDKVDIQEKNEKHPQMYDHMQNVDHPSNLLYINRH